MSSRSPRGSVAVLLVVLLSLCLVGCSAVNVSWTVWTGSACNGSLLGSTSTAVSSAAFGYTTGCLLSGAEGSAVRSADVNCVGRIGNLTGYSDSACQTPVGGFSSVNGACGAGVIVGPISGTVVCPNSAASVASFSLSATAALALLALLVS